MAGLPARIAGGFDFRCLFLDPNAPPHILATAHQDVDFPAQLRAALANAVAALHTAGLDPDRHCRVYIRQRSTTSITVDDAVLYTHIRLAPDGKAVKLTKSAFTLINAHSPLGQELTTEFEDIWNAGIPISSVVQRDPP